MLLPFLLEFAGHACMMNKINAEYRKSEKKYMIYHDKSQVIYHILITSAIFTYELVQGVSRNIGQHWLWDVGIKKRTSSWQDDGIDYWVRSQGRSDTVSHCQGSAIPQANRDSRDMYYNPNSIKSMFIPGFMK